ncbi:hypothetical protein CDL15_Pgr023961 [Punica granatum]|uniref:Uncharacterized protein n=1 Tax=Punica granatum TaxID=22663 RepID=A0A218WV88_PUNGR|nr:hypothetical protein CDL15_Pgr023961 [Punica granatum]
MCVGEQAQQSCKKHERAGSANLRSVKGNVDRPSVHGSPCHGGKVKAVGDLPTKVGTTCLLYGVGGWDERHLVTAHLAMEK